MERVKGGPWSRVTQRVGVALWVSFLAAGAESTVFFALFDPMVLAREALLPEWLIERPAAYGAGFFSFWLFTFIAAGLTAYMLDSSHALRIARGRA